MAERFLPVNPSDRAVEQAIVALKKGAHILKYGRRGKPKLCPFRLSTDERTLMWFSGKEEKQLRLSSVTSIIRGHGNRKLQPERECHSFSLIYMNNQAQCSLDLICKDKLQAYSWFLGLKTVIARSQRHSEIQRGAQSCVNSPASFIRRKYNLGLSKETPKISQVRSVSGSPLFSDGLSLSSDSFFSESSLSSIHNLTDMLVPNSPFIEPADLKKPEVVNSTPKKHPKMLTKFVPSSNEISPRRKKPELSDVLIWGQGVENGSLRGSRDQPIAGYKNGMQVDAMLPKFLDSISMLDVEKISVGGKHAALVTKQGEVFCWGEGKGGRLGHNVNVDVSCPKEVESLSGVHVKSVSCGEYQTCAVSLSGELYRWGDNGSGQNSQWLPRRISGVLDGISISKVACGEWHTAIVSTSRQLFTFGDGTFGVLGHGDCQSLTQPKQVESLKGLRVKSVACGPWHTAAVVGAMIDRGKSNSPVGKLFTWGDGDKGRLGHAGHEMKVLPTCVVQLVDHEFVQVSCGRMLTVGLTSTGMVYTIGSSVHGQLGNPQAQDKSITIVQGKLKFEFVREIASGSYHVAVLTSKGNVYTWGKGANGQLGLGDTEDRSSPTFVEALGRRQVQSISCGSSSTAAICLHRSITCRVDQSACRGCNTDFGFMRKKHNCYNCGLFFCSSCSRKKTKNACLAPVESKSFRVCDSCFTGLEMSSSRGQMLKIEDLSPRPLLINSFPEETEDQVMVPPKLIKMKKGVSDSDSSLMTGAPRWGQVSSPASFRKHCCEDSSAFGNDPKIDPRGSSQPTPLRLKSTTSALANTKRDLVEPDRIISREVEKLRAQADSLERLCYTKGYKTEGCQQRTEETVKRTAAKDVLKALTSRLYSMSPRAYVRKQEKTYVHTNPSLLISKCSDMPTANGMHPTFRAMDIRRDAEVKKLDGVVNMDNKLYIRAAEHGKAARSCDSALMLCDESHVCKAENREVDSSNDSYLQKVKEKHEWVEQYQPGVYITLITLPSGQKGIKRVRFSRKLFNAKKAEKWWEENEIQVYDKYDVDGYINSY